MKELSSIFLPAILISTIAAAAGQLLFKSGASNANSIWSYLNAHILLGFLFYGLSSIVWLYLLSQYPLSKVFPFTYLTIVLVYIGAAVFFSEEIGIRHLGGSVLLVAGLAIIAAGE